MSFSSVQARSAPRTGLWANVRDSIRGVPRDYTTGTIGRAVVLLAIPMVLDMSMQSLFAVVDVFFVARLEPEAAAIAAACLRTVSYSYVFWGFGLVTVQAFNGSGDTTTPTWINFFVFWVVQLPLAWTLSGPVGLGPGGVFVAIAVSQRLLAVVGVIVFRRGTWKRREI